MYYDLEESVFTDAATYVAGELTARDVAVAYIAPGDATEYRFLVARPPAFWAYGAQRATRYYYVALCQSFGAGYEWHGGGVDPAYAAEKWTNAGSSKATRAHTGDIVSRFLTAVSRALKDEPDGEVE